MEELHCTSHSRAPFSRRAKCGPFYHILASFGSASHCGLSVVEQFSAGQEAEIFGLPGGDFEGSRCVITGFDLQKGGLKASEEAHAVNIFSELVL